MSTSFLKKKTSSGEGKPQNESMPSALSDLDVHNQQMLMHSDHVHSKSSLPQVMEEDEEGDTHDQDDSQPRDGNSDDADHVFHNAPDGFAKESVLAMKARQYMYNEAATEDKKPSQVAEQAAADNTSQEPISKEFDFYFDHERHSGTDLE